MSRQSAQAVAPSLHTGMGAVPYDGGVAFRVWAPHADSVHVTGTFNDWAPTAHPLFPEEEGYWSADVEARVGDEYRYLIQNGPQTLNRIDPYARRVTHSSGNAIVYDPAHFDWEGDDFAMPPRHELVLYELHVGTFNRKDPDRPGTFADVARKLHYLENLGINAISLMPVAEFPGDFSWGYNPSHPFAVESTYGGPDELKALVKQAHACGIAVLLDVVYNHFGPAELDLWQFDGWSEHGRGGIYFYNDHRAATPWGETRPDYGRQGVRRYIHDNATMWLEEFHLDGLRWDGTIFIRNKAFWGYPADELPDGWRLMQDINRAVQSSAPGALMIAEDLQQNEWITKPVSEGGAGFGAQWDAAFVHPVRRALITPDDEQRDLEALRAAVTHRYNEKPLERVLYTESHDEVANGKARLPEEIWPGGSESWPAQKRSTLGAALVMTTPGIPMLFQGQEFLEDEWFRDTDPLDWKRLEQLQGLHLLYCDLIALRRNVQGTTRGLTGPHVNAFQLDHESKLLAYHRWDEGGPGDDVVVVLNLADHRHHAYRLGFPRDGWWRVRFNSDWDGYSTGFGGHPAGDVRAGAPGLHDLPQHGEISIGPYTALVLSQDPT